MTNERRGPVILGSILILVGAAFLAANLIGFELAAAWPLFVIVPGLVLFAAAFAVGGQPGSGFAAVGAVAATVGLILAVQRATDLYGTWAYAWALVAPGAIGLGLLLYGLLTGQREFVSAGLPALGVGLALFLGFGLFFEGVIGLSGDRVPALRGLLPVGLVALGAVLVVGSLVGRRHHP